MSFPCEALISDPPDQTEAFHCSLFHSLDIDRARAVFSHLQTHLWDILPAGWYQNSVKHNQENDPELYHVCFSSSDRFAVSEEAAPLRRGSFTLSFKDTDMVLGYGVELNSFSCFFDENEHVTRKGGSPDLGTGLSESSGASGANDPSRNDRGPKSRAVEIQHEIDKIRSSPHGAIPQAQATPSALGGQTGMTVENRTSCTLSVFISGPASENIQLAPGGSQTVGLSPGNYELAASVSCPNVIPFYGTQTLAANTQYSENFYIGVK